MRLMIHTKHIFGHVPIIIGTVDASYIPTAAKSKTDQTTSSQSKDELEVQCFSFIYFSSLSLPCFTSTVACRSVVLHSWLFQHAQRVR